MSYILYIYIAVLIIASLISFFMYGYDKNLAKKNKMRIKEKYLLQVAILGGGLGALIGRIVFKHKTNKIYFSIVIISSILLELITLGLMIGLR